MYICNQYNLYPDNVDNIKLLRSV